MSTQAELAVSYDMPLEFYRLWLDERMNYSCAIFEQNESLELAQLNKLRFMYEAARVTPDKRVLDIGCGWGANLDYLAIDRGVANVVGITLSRAQFEHLEARRAARSVRVHCVSYRDYQPEEQFDALISIGMFEHIATPREAREGKHIAMYRDYFRRAWEWTRPGSWFSLQSVIGLSIPRDPGALAEIGWTTYHIFPGAIAPRLEAVIVAAHPYWEVMELRTRREHYARTTAEWLRRLRASEPVIRQRWGEERFLAYERYLAACVMAFEEGYQSLLQLALRRID